MVIPQIAWAFTDEIERINIELSTRNKLRLIDDLEQFLQTFQAKSESRRYSAYTCWSSGASDVANLSAVRQRCTAFTQAGRNGPN